MKHFRTLIKLKKREVDLFRKQIAQLQEQRTILERLIEVLEQDLRREVILAGDLVHMGVFFGDYSEAIKQKQQMVAEKLHAVDTQIELIAEKMRIAYGEQKTYEIVQKRQVAAIAYKQTQKEQQFMDERAARNHAQG
jgi:flagellar biosynthesis chaperone FliJ